MERLERIILPEARFIYTVERRALHNDAIRLCMTDAEDKLLIFWDKLHSLVFASGGYATELEQFFLQNKKYYTWEFHILEGCDSVCQ